MPHPRNSLIVCLFCIIQKLGHPRNSLKVVFLFSIIKKLGHHRNSLGYYPLTLIVPRLPRRISQQGLAIGVWLLVMLHNELRANMLFPMHIFLCNFKRSHLHFSLLHSQQKQIILVLGINPGKETRRDPIFQETQPNSCASWHKFHGPKALEFYVVEKLSAVQEKKNANNHPIPSLLPIKKRREPVAVQQAPLICIFFSFICIYI